MGGFKVLRFVQLFLAIFQQEKLAKTFLVGPDLVLMRL